VQNKWEMSDVFTSVDTLSLSEFVAFVQKGIDLWVRDEKGNTLLHRAVVASADPLYKTNLLLEHCPTLLHTRNELLETPLQTLLAQTISQKESGKPTAATFPSTLALLLACGANVETMNAKGIRCVTLLRQLGLIQEGQLPSVAPLDLAQKQLSLRKGVQSLLEEQESSDHVILFSRQLRRSLEQLTHVDRLPLTRVGALLAPREWLSSNPEKTGGSKLKTKTPSKPPKALRPMEAQITQAILHFSEALHVPQSQRTYILSLLQALRNYYTQPLPEGAENPLLKHRFFLSGLGLDLQALSYGASLFFESYFEEKARLLPSSLPLASTRSKIAFQNGTINDVYYRLKTSGLEMDEAVRQLSQVIFSGQSMAVSGCLFLHQVSQEGKEIRRDYLPLFASKPSTGPSLAQVLRTKGNSGLNTRFHSYHYSVHFLLSCLTQPGEGLPEHYVVSEPRGEGKFGELIGIESVGCFSPLVKQNDDSKQHHLGIKTVIFCLSQMDEPMDLVARREFLAQDPAMWVLQWLKGISAFRSDFSAECLSLWGTSEENSSLEYLCTSPMAIALYHAMHRLQAMVKANPSLTHQAILATFEPLLGAYYEKVRQVAKGDWEQAKPMLEQSEFLETWSQQQLAIRPLWEKAKSAMITTKPTISPTSMATVCQAVLAEIDFSSIDAINQRRLLEEAVRNFPTIQQLSLKGCQVLDEPLCVFFSEHLTELVAFSLEGCTGISATALQRLLVRFPALDFKLANMPALSPADILLLEQHSQNLSVAFGSKTYILKSTQLSPAAQQATRQACFREAIAEGTIDWSLFFLQSGVHLGEGSFSPLHEAIVHYQPVLLKHMLLWGLDANALWKHTMPLDVAYTTYEAAPKGKQKETALLILGELLKAGAVQCDKKHAPAILSAGMKLQETHPDMDLLPCLWQFGLGRGCLTSEDASGLLPREKSEPLSLSYRLSPWANDFFAQLQAQKRTLRILNITGCEGFDKAMLAYGILNGLETLILDVAQANALDLLQNPLPNLEITLSSLELDPKNTARDFPALLRVLERPSCRLEVLRIYGVEFTFEQWLQLCSALNGYRHLKVLQLREVPCEAHLPLLLAALKNSALEEVILERVVQPSEWEGNREQQSLLYCQALATFVREQPRLRKLSLDRNHWGDIGLSALLGAFAKHPGLKELYLNEVEMTEGGLENLRTALMRTSKVRKLDIRFNRLSASSMLRLIGLVQFNVHLQEVLYEEQYAPQGQDSVKLARDPKIVSALRRNRVHDLSQQRLPLSERNRLTEGEVENPLAQGLLKKKAGTLVHHRTRRAGMMGDVQSFVPAGYRQQRLLDHVPFAEILKAIPPYQATLTKTESAFLLEARWEQKDRFFWEGELSGLKRSSDEDLQPNTVIQSLQKAHTVSIVHAEEQRDRLARLRLKQAALIAFENGLTFQNACVQAMQRRGLMKAAFDFSQSLILEVLLEAALSCESTLFLNPLVTFLSQSKAVKLINQLCAICDRTGKNLLMWAASQGNTEQVSWLLDQGMAIHAADHANRTVFLFAALGGNLAVLNHLKDRGADIHHEDAYGRNALGYAAQGGNLPAMEWLLTLSDRFSLSGKSVLLETPLLLAAMGGQVAILDTLLAKQVGSLTDVDKAGEDLLFIAARADQPAVVEWALSKGLSFDQPNVSGKTARAFWGSINHPALKAWWELREALHGQASDAVVQSALTACLAIEGGRGTPLRALSWASLVAHGRLAILLANEPNVPSANWCAVDHQGNTLLHVAALHHQAKVAAWLLKKGLLGQEKNALGQTAHHVALKAGATEVSGVLLGLSAPVLTESALQIYQTPQGEKKLLGEGAFSRVYGGRWQHSEVAYKILTLEVSFNSSAFTQFTSEVNLLAKSQHPHVVRLYGVTLSPLGLVMECVSQGSLRSVLEETKSGKRLSFTWGQRVTMGEDVAKGLAFLHSPTIGLCHRDLKSDNVLLDEQLRAKLTDFGLAEVKSLAGPKGAAGSVAWLAPETLSQDPVQTMASDIYSYGVTLWELATQQIPYEGLPLDAIRQKIGHQKTLLLPENLPKAWASLMENCWQLSPSERPNAEEVLHYFHDHRTELEGGTQQGNSAVADFKRHIGLPYRAKTLRYLFPMLENRGRLLRYVMNANCNLEKALNYLAILSVTFGKPVAFLYKLPEKKGVCGGLLFGQRLLWIDVRGRPPELRYEPLFQALKSAGAITHVFFSKTCFFSGEEKIVAGQAATVLVEFFRAVLQLPLEQLLAFAERLPNELPEERFSVAASVDIGRFLSPALKILQAALPNAVLEQLVLFRQQHLLLLESQPREAVASGQCETEAAYIHQCTESLCQTLFPTLSEVFDSNGIPFKLFTGSLRTFLTVPADKPLIARLQKLAQELAVEDNHMASIRVLPASDLTFIQQVGQGGFGEVYRGYWQQTLVAIKKLHGVNLSPPILREFRNEAALLSGIHHPNVVGCYGICTDIVDSPLSLILEFLPRGGLDGQLRDHQNLPKLVLPDWSIRQRIALDIARGVACLHERGIVHGDLRACNILLDGEYHAKIADFGLAKQRSAHLTVLTTNERTFGVYNWLSPELLRTGKRTFASDVYSFGFILWELMTGKVPYHEANLSNDVNQLESLVESSRAIELHIPPSDTPPVFVKLMRQCLVNDPSSRPTMHAIVEMLFRAVSPAEYEIYYRTRYPDSVQKEEGEQPTLRTQTTGRQQEDYGRNLGEVTHTFNDAVEESLEESDGISDDDSESDHLGHEDQKDILRGLIIGRYGEMATAPLTLEPENVVEEESVLRSTLTEGYALTTTTTTTTRQSAANVVLENSALRSNFTDGYTAPAFVVPSLFSQPSRLREKSEGRFPLQPPRPAAPPPRPSVFAPATPPPRPLPVAPGSRGNKTTTTATTTTATTTASLQAGFKQ
jgi:serine/threonine protein kinase/ankyrin repeat protein